MSGVGGIECQGDRLEVAQLADHDDVGILTERRFQTARVAGDVASDLALVDEALITLMHELDRVFEGDDMGFPVLVDGKKSPMVPCSARTRSSSSLVPSVARFRVNKVREIRIVASANVLRWRSARTGFNFQRPSRSGRGVPADPVSDPHHGSARTPGSGQGILQHPQGSRASSPVPPVAASRQRSQRWWTCMSPLIRQRGL